MIKVDWCDLCQSRPADGVLEAQLEPDTTALQLNACTDCVARIPKENWMKTKEDSHGKHDN